MLHRVFDDWLQNEPRDEHVAALVPLLAHPQLIDAAPNEHRRGVEKRDVIRHQAPAGVERRDVEDIPRRVVRRYGYLGGARSGGGPERASVETRDLIWYLAPLH